LRRRGKPPDKTPKWLTLWGFFVSKVELVLERWDIANYYI